MDGVAGEVTQERVDDVVHTGDDDDDDYDDDGGDVCYDDGDDGDAGLGEGGRGQNVENPYIG